MDITQDQIKYNGYYTTSNHTQQQKVLHRVNLSLLTKLIKVQKTKLQIIQQFNFFVQTMFLYHKCHMYKLKGQNQKNNKIFTNFQ